MILCKESSQSDFVMRTLENGTMEIRCGNLSITGNEQGTAITYDPRQQRDLNNNNEHTNNKINNNPIY